MKTVIEGVLQADLPWGLVFIGAGISLVAQLVGLRPLAFAVGIYLPLSTMTPVFIGGVLRWMVENVFTKKGEELEGRSDQGILFGSGLIAGEGIMGVLIAFYAFFLGKPAGLGIAWPEPWGEALSFIIFMSLGLWLLSIARRRQPVV